MGRLSTPSESAKRFETLLRSLGPAIGDLPDKEKVHASQLVREVARNFRNTIAEDVDRDDPESFERNPWLVKTRERLTELERLLSGQRLMFASRAAVRVAGRYLEAADPHADTFKELFEILDDIGESILADTMRALGIKPKPKRPQPRGPKAPKTYAKAQAEILRALGSKGWSVSTGLKIPHATNQHNTVRLWFKPQAIYISYGSDVRDFHSARSLWSSDYRFIETDKFVKDLERLVERYHKDVAARSDIL